MSNGVKPQGRRGRFAAIATDLHFWIPLVILLGGLVLLDQLR